MSNSIYGKLLYSAQKYQTVTKIITISEARFGKMSCDSLLKDYYLIAKEVVCTEYRIMFSLFVGWFIFYISKCYKYNMYYNVIKNSKKRFFLNLYGHR